MKRSKPKRRCPKCGSREIILQDTSDDGVDLYICLECNREFEIGDSRDNRYDIDDEDDIDFDDTDRVLSEYDDDKDEWN